MAALLFAHSKVTVVADSYSDPSEAPVTFELDLWFLGTGNTTRERGVYRGDGDVTFDYKSQRTANTSGTFQIDGRRAQLTSATLMHETSGTITLPAAPASAR